MSCELVKVGKNDVRRITRGVVLVAGIHYDPGFSAQDLLAQLSDDLLDPFSLILQQRLRRIQEEYTPLIELEQCWNQSRLRFTAARTSGEDGVLSRQNFSTKFHLVLVWLFAIQSSA